MAEEKIITLLENAENVNIVGKESIKIGIKAGIIIKENIITIEGIPHAQYATIE